MERRTFLLTVGLGLGAIGTCALPAWRNAGSVRGATPAGMKPVRVGLVFDVGGRGDKSFNDAAYEGLARAERELGAQIEYVEPADADDRVAAMRLFASRGFDLVIGVGYMFSRDVDEVARDAPSIHFACVDYALPESGAVPGNVVGLKFREPEGAFLVGAIAALTSKTGTVGFVGGMDIPLIRRFERGYREGVQAVCPSCRVLAAYAGSTPDAFRDPAAGEAHAMSQFSQNADVIFHASGTTGHGVFVAAHRAGRFAIGVDADQYDEMPDVMLTSMLKHVDVAVFNAIADIARGQFSRDTQGIRTFGVADGGIDFVREGAHAHHIAAATLARVAQLRNEIIDGTRKINAE